MFVDVSPFPNYLDENNPSKCRSALWRAEALNTVGSQQARVGCIFFPYRVTIWGVKLHPANPFYIDGKLNKTSGSCPRSIILTQRGRTVLDKGASCEKLCLHDSGGQQEGLACVYTVRTCCALKILNFIFYELFNITAEPPPPFCPFSYLPHNKFELVCFMVVDAVIWYLPFFRENLVKC